MVTHENPERVSDLRKHDFEEHSSRNLQSMAESGEFVFLFIELIITL